MKLSKKKIAVISLILCLVSIVSMGSLAWFTDSDSVDNTFAFENFEVEVCETNKKGNLVNAGLTFTNLVPGDKLTKDPTVVNKSATEDQWVRVTVTANKYSTWSEVYANAVNANSAFTLGDIFTGFESTKWTRFDNPAIDTQADTVTYVYYLNDKLAADGGQATLFTGVTIPTVMTLDQAKALEGATITIKAEAMQVSNLGDNVKTAKDAFALVD